MFKTSKMSKIAKISIMSVMSVMSKTTKTSKCGVTECPDLNAADLVIFVVSGEVSLTKLRPDWPQRPS